MNPMLLFPAIDLMDGQVVRLQRGDADRKTVYSDDPPAFARKWQELGGDWIHVVDLDAAFTGRQSNLETVRTICSTVGIPCQVGGGLRDRDAVARVFDAGVARAIIGTRAVESLDFVAALCAEFGGERIAVGIDARDGLVAVKGWTETTKRKAVDLAADAIRLGAGTIIYTDIATDGMLQGPDFEGLKRMLELPGINLIASGGVSSPDDVRRLAELPGLYGAIIGRALYDGKITGNLRPLVQSS